jgi:Domain of unknown function (DUF6378)
MSNNLEWDTNTRMVSGYDASAWSALDGWRVPTEKELQSLFGKGYAGAYWSSTKLIGGMGAIVNFDNESTYMCGFHMVEKLMLVRSVDIPADNPKLEEVLVDRGQRYGEFKELAVISQALKTTMIGSSGWQHLEPYQCEALEMIAHKIARILNGDANYADSWVDIAGYATLVESRLGGKGEGS